MPVEIYSTETDCNLVSVIHKEGPGRYELVERIGVGRAPRGGVKFTADGRGYVSNFDEDTISEIDLAARRETARIPVGRAPRGVAVVPGGRFALVSNSGAKSLSLVDLAARQEVGRVTVGDGPRHMDVTPDGRWAYVAMWGARYVAKIDLRRLVDVNHPAAGPGVHEAAKLGLGELGHPYSVAIHGDGRRGYVANADAPYVSVIDLETGEMVGWVHVGGKGGRSVAFSPDGRYAFATVEHRSEVVAIDVTDHRVVRRIPVGPCPRGLAVEPHELTLYSSGFSRTPRQQARSSCPPKAVTVVQLGSPEALESGAEPEYAEVPVGPGPSGVSVIDRRTA